MHASDMSFPTFTYFADPIGSRVCETSDSRCSCCDQLRGWEYLGSMDLPNNLDPPDSVCPWCIADGTAADRFGICFHDESCLIDKSLPSTVVEEIVFRTPAYSSWQEPRWLCHCQDACIYCGDLSIEEAASPDWTAICALLNEPFHRALVAWERIARNYRVAAPSVFKFVCRHCKKVFYQVDSP